MLKLVVYLSFFACSIIAQAHSIVIENARDYEVLSHFFKTTFTDNEFGYVFEDVKPVCVIGFGSLDRGPYFGNYELSEKEFIKSILAREALGCWQKIAPSQSKFVLKAVPLDKSSPITSGYEVRLVNLPKLREIIRQHVSLFRYLLDPSATIDELANCIAFSDQQLCDIIKGDQVLSGIILGYGYHNSLIYGRMATLAELTISSEAPPFLCKSRLMKSHNEEQHFLSYLTPESYGNYYLDYAGGDTSHFKKPHQSSGALMPTPKFLSLEKEIIALASKNEELPQSLSEIPNFIFGAYKGEVSNQLFFQKLQSAQKNIQRLLDQPLFLERVLEKFGGDQPRISCQKPQSNKDILDVVKQNKEDWSAILKAVKNKHLGQKKQEAFVQAFSHPSDADRKLPPMMGASEAALKGLKSALVNLSRANAYFEKIKRDKNLKVISEDQLYYEIRILGSGKPMENLDEVRIGYTLEDLDGNILHANHDTWLNLSETFPAFALGIQGMRLSEQRFLYIHPSVGYGALTTLPPCMTLLAKVHLYEIGKKMVKVPELEPHDFSWLTDPKYLQSMEESLDQLPKTRGAFYHDILDKIGAEIENRQTVLKSKMPNKSKAKE